MSEDSDMHDERNGGTAMGLPEAEQGTTGTPRDEREEADGTRRFRVGGEQTPRVVVGAISGALRVLGEEGTDQVSVRAVKPNGETVPLDLVADVQVRLNGEISVKMRPAGEIQRQVRRITKSFDFSRGDLFDNLGEVIDALAAMKTAGGNIDRVRLEVTVPHHCDLVLTTASGAIQVGRVEGSVQAQSASGNIDCARIGGKLTVRSASGNLRLGDITGTTSAQTMSGDVTTRGVDGNLVIHTASGDAQSQDMVGLFGFKSQSGGLSVRDSRLTGFYINTTSGDCLVEASLAAGEYEVRTVSGDIALRPQPDLNAVLTGRTVSGSFRCSLPYRYADDDWRAAMEDDDDDEERGRGFDAPEIELPGLRIGKEGIDVAGFLRIDDETLSMPGMRIDLRKDKRDRDRERRRERRRGRNRWEYLIGDPALAAAGQTRLRVRSVSGDLTIRAGNSDAPGEARAAGAADTGTTGRGTATASTATTRTHRGWPDSELWPETAPVPPTPPAPPVAPAFPAAPPPPPTPPGPPAPSGEAGAATGAVDATASAPPVAVTEIAAPDTPDLPDAPEAAADAPEVAADAPEVTAEAAAAETTEAPGEPVAASAEERAHADQTRLDILEALRRGEITTDEALLLLRQLDE
jgi:hypothetical protein